jgi:hypothetical protein
MRNLALNEVNQIAGGAIGDSTVYSFDLKAGVEVIGMEAVVVDYITSSYTEKGFWGDKTTYVVDTPVYAYYPVYAETVTYVY